MGSDGPRGSRVLTVFGEEENLSVGPAIETVCLWEISDSKEGRPRVALFPLGISSVFRMIELLFLSY